MLINNILNQIQRQKSLSREINIWMLLCIQGCLRRCIHWQNMYLTLEPDFVRLKMLVLFHLHDIYPLLRKIKAHFGSNILI